MEPVNMLNILTKKQPAARGVPRGTVRRKPECNTMSPADKRDGVVTP
jgi:hypothetical protein